VTKIINLLTNKNARDVSANAPEQKPTTQACASKNHLNHNELKSVRSLLAYIAHTQAASEETVRAILETTFGVDDFNSLPQKSYEDAIRFLVDLRLEEIMN
jgi:hypothetical protein